MSNSELMPCPFCGDTDVQIEPYLGSGTYYQVRCGGCRCGGPIGFHYEVVDEWNRRVSKPSEPKGVERG